MITTKITIEIPDYLRRQAEVLAENKKISLDRVVSLALAGHLTSQLEENYMEELATRSGWEHFKAAVYSRTQLKPPEFARS